MVSANWLFTQQHPGNVSGGNGCFLPFLPHQLLLKNWLCCLWKELGGFSEESVVPLGLYAGQLALNWAWTPIFFGAHKIGWGLVDLLLMSGAATATAVTWYHVNKKAGYLMFPCLAWLTLASVLNYRFSPPPTQKKPNNPHQVPA
uniref:Translocator protein n=1 Tax=Gopherus evgoodei TaxID=1825980 RepID=A0A8C4WLP9_9SAUR